ncbi:MAG TPA: hypothetical protein VMS65_02235 [Polyangiaceae bacterium]|nr:hypothetical protein [Polyangiaceae bacterium]
MPEKKTIERAKADLRRGKSPSTAAGEFVREEIEHIREGKHGARSTKQAIAIALSKARRAGVPLAAPARGRTSERTRRSAERELATARGERKPRSPSPKRSRAMRARLKREPKRAASKQALSRHAKTTRRERPTSRKTGQGRTRRAKASER